MAQYQVPQFIETEDKIVGPFTLKQFLFIAGAGAIAFITFYIFVFWLWILITAVVATIAFAFAFVKYNGQPSYLILGYALRFVWQPKMYLWKRSMTKERVAPAEVSLGKSMPQKSGGGLKSLWLNIASSNQSIPNREKVAPIIRPNQESDFDSIRKIQAEKEKIRRVDYR